MNHTDLIIVGNCGGTHIGASLQRAAARIRKSAVLCDAAAAYSGPALLNRLNWRFRGHRPTSLEIFSSSVVDACRTHSPKAVLTTGLAPLNAESLSEIGRMGIRRLNYLTDDPWNPTHLSKWFLKALTLYDHVFSPRRANLSDLNNHGCKGVRYLPFAYDDELFFAPPSNRLQRTFDILFAGGADADRVPFVQQLTDAGLEVGLAGGYWDRFPVPQRFNLGNLPVEALRDVTSNSKTALCLVRRANRDGHVMRTFEIPAIGTAMLAEDTPEHRAIFGEDGAAVRYFRTPMEMAERARWMVEHDEDRRRMAANAHRLIVDGRNTYKDRLEEMLAAL